MSRITNAVITKKALPYGKVVNRIEKSEWVSNGNAWDHPAIVRNAICENDNGKLHTVYLGQDADTYSSWPGRVKWGGRWHKGTVAIKYYPADSDNQESVFTCHDCYNGNH